MSTHSLDQQIVKQRLIEIIRKIHECVELAKLRHLIATELKALLKVDRVLIHELREELDEVKTPPSDRADRYANSVPKSLEEVYHSNLQSTLMISENWEHSLEIGGEITQIFIPIVSKRREWGILVIEHKSKLRPWELEDSKLVQEVVFHISIAVEHHRMYQEEQKQKRILNLAVERVAEEHITIAGIIDKIRRSLDIKTILRTTTAETRKFFQCDRVAIYRFNTDHSGEFIAESVAEGWRSLRKNSPQDVDNQGEEYCTNLWDNLEFSDTYLEGTAAKTFNPEDLFRVCDDIYEAGFSQDYVQLLEKYQVQAYIFVAIYKNSTLWGLLAICQNSSPRHWETREINFMVQLGVNLAIALQQGELLARTQEQEKQLQTALETALKQQTDTLLKINQKERALGRVIDKIRQTLDLKTIFQTAATEMQQLLRVEHIAIYRFDKSYGGEFIFESDPGDFTSLVGKSWNDDYLQETQGGRFQNNQPCIIDDVRRENNVSQCYLAALEGFLVRSLAIVPLFQGSQLWGLLAGFEHSRCRQWKTDEIKLLQRVARHLSVGLQQSFYFQQVKEYGEEQGIILEQERALLEVIDKIRRTLDLDTIFQTSVTEIRQLLKADRVCIFRFDPGSEFALAELISEDVADEYPSCLKAQVEDHCFAKQKETFFKQNHIFTIDDISKANMLDCHRQTLERFNVKANLVAPLLMGKRLWGLLCIHQCSGPRHWKTREKGFITKIATHLSVGIQQAALLKDSQQRARVLETTLEQVQVQKRHLGDIASQEKALSRVIERIRQSLTLEKIFASTTEEVRQMLNCDRVVVYRFWENWGGEFLYESVGPGWKPLVGEGAENTMWEDSYLQNTKGGRYRHQEIFLVRDVETADLAPCHREIYQQFQIRALMTIPVFSGEKLWGILGVYDNQQPRYWHRREINIVKQVANQLGVAIYQSNLLRRTRKQSEMLQRTLADLNAIVDNLGNGLLVVDILGKITRYNPTLQSMFQMTSSLLGRKVVDIFPPELSTLLEKKELQEQEVVTMEVPLAKGVGQALASNIIKESEGGSQEFLGVVILIRDITKEREIEEMKKNFLSMVSHELRTPLTSIVGFSSLVRDKLNELIFPQIENPDSQTSKTMDRIQQNLDIVVSEGERLSNLVNDFLDMTKIESGKITLNLFPVKPSTILSWAIASTMPLFDTSPVELIEDFSPDLPTILGDEDRLIQVLVNLISNSFKFTEKGSVTCHAEVDHNDLLISIIDTGIGIAENDYRKVFKPFQQVGNMLTNKPKGTGLGLSISQQIVEQHGGKIWCTSKVGKGTTFFVSLPLKQEN
ncbi:GAF domain-containing protein [Crocosphaera sp.]|uniref:GAF domain-containing protein n=1 Tax=Crocosphaera sp. TaxID=2729996 RepID=UPI002622B2C3|nr:GAF domain-containing protein [Crocosphaera sp.]MDJ0578906.1 GAF domain-containing protein [Crocosphaera sp.]